MRPALWSVVIQAAGSAATFASALLVASQLGLAAQGEFGLLRSWSDAAVTVAVLGFPQALLHLQYRERAPMAALRAWVGRYVMVLTAVALIVILVAAVLWPTQHSSRWPALMSLQVIALAVPLAAAQLLWRSLMLREVGAVPYAAITAAPAMLVLLGLVPLCLAQRSGGFAWVLFGAAAVSAMLSGALTHRLARRDANRASAAWSRRSLWTVSLETGGQSVLTALAPPLVLSTASWLGGPLAQVGIVSLGLHLYQLFGVAAAYVAPMVYDRAARADAGLGGRELLALIRAGVTRRVGFGMVGVALLALGVMPLLWPAGVASWVLLGGMAMAGVVSMAVRLLVTLLLARGAFRPLTLHALGRVLISCALTAALMRIWPAPVAVPLALMLTELALFGWALGLMRLALVRIDR